jgi:hypothetical protein
MYPYLGYHTYRLKYMYMNTHLTQVDVFRYPYLEYHENRALVP